MFSDARKLNLRRPFEADLCIIGGGPTGITIARAFAGRSTKVCLLESGGLNPSRETSALNDGEVVGQDYHLGEMRARYFGGSSGYWSGWCRPLERMDFEPRPWIPGSGWPIKREDLDPYYEQAQRDCQVGPLDYDPESWASRSRPVIRFDGDHFRPIVWQFSPPTRFGKEYRHELEQAGNIHVLLNANVIDFSTTADAGHVEAVKVACLDGTRFEVRARWFVLACGGIENARILLLADSVERGGLGNRYDHVGRYYMDHPHVRTDSVVFIEPDVDLGFYAQDRSMTARIRNRIGKTLEFARPVRTVGGFGLTEAAQRDNRILNYSVQYIEPPAEAVARLQDDISKMTVSERTSRLRRPSHPPLWVRLYVRSEQQPNPDSRITLGEIRDALGQRRVRHDWRLTDLDKRTIREAHHLMARALGQAGLGRLRIDPWLLRDDESWENLHGWGHPSGTTRMSARPEDGVVDPACRVHSTDNLYVSGTSVFPTVGTAHPTLTVVALAHRLVEHLQTKV